ncbi:Hypothetical_protein [Hexamita inflata]|uniref:Hypothetical_protein n=1 Tax=Hexamita inflata TaxID=28002 RepID=A0AA86P3Y7_9EUKA|nr:Hypothetical protein HINF_LOCUS19467 [Hexamita inflata]
MYNEYISKQQQKGIVVDICQNQLSMEVQGEKDTFDKSYQSNDSQNLTQTVIHGADSLCSTRNLCRSSVEDFDADSGKTSSKICQDSFLNKAGYFPNGHHPVEQVRNTLQNPQSCQQEKLYGKVSQVHQVPSLTNNTRGNDQFICHFMWFSDILRYLTNRTELMTNRPNLITNIYYNLNHLIKVIQSLLYQSFVNIQLKSLINNSLNNNSINFYKLILKLQKRISPIVSYKLLQLNPLLSLNSLKCYGFSSLSSKEWYAFIKQRNKNLLNR